jgi:hypothetical protein
MLGILNIQYLIYLFRYGPDSKISKDPSEALYFFYLILYLTYIKP